MPLAPGKRGRRVLADQKAGGWGRGHGRGAAGPFSGGLSTKIHLAVCIKIQRRASGSLKTWACKPTLLRTGEPGTAEVVAFLSQAAQ